MCVNVCACIYIYTYTYTQGHWPNGRVFANGLGDGGSISGQVIPKMQTMVLDATLLNIQHYKVEINGKVEQSREWSGTHPYTSVTNFTFIYIYIYIYIRVIQWKKEILWK